MLNRFEQFSAAISCIYRHIQKLERDEMVKYGYKGAFAQYLVVLRRYPEGVTATRMCEICDKDKAAISRIVVEMETKGLVSREGGHNGKYRAVITLTDEGKKAADFVCQKARTAVEEVGTALSDTERMGMYAALESIAARLQTLSREGIPEYEAD